jgi:hypothetical protein
MTILEPPNSTMSIPIAFLILLTYESNSRTIGIDYTYTIKLFPYKLAISQ